MKLSIVERLSFGKLLPKEGNMIEQTIVKDISEKIVLNQEEIVKIGLKIENEKFIWNQQEAIDKEIVFTKLELDLLQKQIKKLDNDKKISQENINLCIKINDEKEESKVIKEEENKEV